MKNSRRGFIVPLLLVVIAALLAGGGYLYIQNQQSIQQQSNADLEPRPTETTSQKPTQSPNNPGLVWKVYNGSLVPGDYEDTSGTVNYSFNYPDTISVTSSDKRQLMLTDSISGRISAINVSYEGGRGYSPTDMFNQQIKKTCADCVVVPNKISVQGNTGLITVIGGGKEWLIFAPPTDSQWLITASLSSASDQTAEKIISTFKFTN